jgi:hypothetical protein
MRRRLLSNTVMAAALVFSAACIMVVDPLDPDAPGSARIPTRAFEKTLDFAPGGTLSVSHAVGSVRIAGWDREAVEIVASGGRDAFGKDGHIRIMGPWDPGQQVEVEETETGIDIRTTLSRTSREPRPLDYTIRVPASVNLEAVRLERGEVAVADLYGRVGIEVGEGAVTVRNFSGPLTVSIGAGPADVEILDVRPADAVDITARKGDIVLRLEPGASVRIEAEAPQGEITSDFDLGPELPVKTLSAALGEGAASVTLRAPEGNIRILKTD